MVARDGRREVWSSSAPFLRREWDGGGLCDGRKEKSIQADNVTHREEVEDEYR